MRYLFKAILILIFIQNGKFYAQSVVQLFVEDFNQPTISWLLNDSVSGPNIGTNNWIINDQYGGVGFVPNTTPQTSTFGGRQPVTALNCLSRPHPQLAPTGILNATHRACLVLRCQPEGAGDYHPVPDPATGEIVGEPAPPH